jgi:hypothetical protein
LRNVYAKVGVRSRTELARRLAAQAGKVITAWIAAVTSAGVDWELASRMSIG